MRSKKCVAEKKLTLDFRERICNTFQSHSIAVLLKYMLHCSVRLHYSAWDAQQAYRKTRWPNVISVDVRNFCFSSSLPTSTRAHHPSERLCGTRQFAWKQLCDGHGRALWGMRRLTRCAADSSSQTEHDRNLGVSSSARRNDTQLDFPVLLFVCGLQFLLRPGAIDREPIYDQPININDIDTVRNV